LADLARAIPTLEVRNREQWRAWLRKHHASSRGVWLVYFKDHTGVKSVDYEDSVREALCFGWVDSLIKRLDDDCYARKFTPRKPTSKWSESNLKRWAELEKAGLIEGAGRAAAPTRKTFAPAPKIPRLPAYIAKALRANPKAWRFFSGVGSHPPSAFRSVDSYGQETGDAREAHPRIRCSSGNREKARLEIAPG
jgi:uncharacterized protein YdeI (YjbR/CyaY-like superfamily)